MILAWPGRPHPIALRLAPATGPGVDGVALIVWRNVRARMQISVFQCVMTSARSIGCAHSEWPRSRSRISRESSRYPFARILKIT